MPLHWGTFTKPWALQFALDQSQNAMSLYPLIVDQTSGDGDYLVIGHGAGDLIVQTTCVPQGADSTWFAVSAFSEDSSAAEVARNTIREWLVKA